MEYGSDFSIELGNLTCTKDNIFNYLKQFHSLYFDSGRSATKYLLSFIPVKYIALPEYLCESIVDCFPDVKKYYYSVNDSFEIEELEKIPWDQIDTFYLLHYFGSLQPENVLKFIDEKRKKYQFCIIEDTTHSIFTKSVTIGDYCIASIRKWFPVPDGGILYSQKSLDESGYNRLSEIQSNRIEAMVLKNLYLKNVVKEKKIFREIFEQTENNFDKQINVYRMSAISMFILHCQEIRKSIDRRKKNHLLLSKKIRDILPEIIDRKETDIPFTYITKVDDRDQLRDYFNKNSVYCPVHWPFPACWPVNSSIEISKRVISIPIDQRYCESEVIRVAQIVRGFYNE